MRGRVTVELGEHVETALEAPGFGGLPRALETAVAEERRRLGIPGAPAVEVVAGDVPRGVRVLAGGELVPYPPSYDPQRVALMDEIADAPIAERVVQVVVAILRQRPSCLLMGTRIQRLDQPLVAELLDLGLTLPAARSALTSVRGVALQPLPDHELVELAFAHARQPQVDVLAHPAVLEELAGGPIGKPTWMWEEPVSEEWLTAVQGCEEAILEAQGVRLPPLRLVPDPDADLWLCGLSMPGQPVRFVGTSGREVLLGLMALAAERPGPLLSLTEVEQSLANLMPVFPEIVSALAAAIPTTDLVRVLRLLLAEGVPVRDLRTIADRMLDLEGGVDIRPEAYADWVRRGFRDLFAHRHAPDGRLHAVVVAPELAGRAEHFGPLGPDESRRVRDEITDALEGATDGRVLLTSPGARRALRDAVAPELPSLPVLARDELPPAVEVVHVASVGASLSGSPAP